MCYDGCITKKWLTKSLLDDDLVVLFISDFSKKGNKALVTYMEDGMCKNRMFNFSIKTPDDIAKAITALECEEDCKKVSILSFTNVTDKLFTV